jgi:hypothetical protein
VITLSDHTPREIEQIISQAETEDRQAAKAEQVVTEAVNQMNPQRQYSEDQSQNKR